VNVLQAQYQSAGSTFRMCFSTFANVLFLTAWGFRGGTYERSHVRNYNEGHQWHLQWGFGIGSEVYRTDWTFGSDFVRISILGFGSDFVKYLKLRHLQPCVVSHFPLV